MIHSRISPLCLSLLLVASAAHAVGGKWTPEQLLAHDPEWLQGLGLEVPAQELWSPGEGGLLEAVVQVGGCSSGFVSPQGLLITNHHCVFGILQHHSTAENDIIASGYLAENAADELPGPAVRASIPSRFTDVTDAIGAAVRKGADDLERFEAIETKKKALVASCEEQENRRCTVAVYDDGVRYTLIEAIEYPDVRLVYAPPRAVGEYGGEIDNWMWPRHTGDFSLLRVYTAPGGRPAEYAEDNVPLIPKRHLQIARQGVSDGSFVMVVGYPGRTYRRLTRSEMEERHERYFPSRAALYQGWMEIIAAAGERDEEARIAMASRFKGLANREKNARGQVAAIDRGDLVGKKAAAEAEVIEWIAEHPEHAGALDSYRGLEALAAEVLADWDRDFLLGEVRAGALPLSLALTVTRWSIASEKPDAQRRADYQERNRARARSELERAQSTLHAATDAELMTDWWRRLRALPADQRVAPLDAIVPVDASDDAVRAAVDRLLAETSVTDEEARLEMFAESPAELRAREDRLIDLAFALQKADYLPREKTTDRRAGAQLRLRPAWRRAVEAHAGRPIDPDANGTLRVSLAHVKGYSPREAVWMKPLTTVAGVIEKHIGADPFDVPRGRAPARPDGPRRAVRALDPTVGLEGVPVNFLANCDTTGGNSGSPAIDSRGRLVGVNFDRVWENITNDFGYNPDIARNVTADVRYLLWLLDEVEGEKAERILEELQLLATPVAPAEEASSNEIDATIWNVISDTVAAGIFEGMAATYHPDAVLVSSKGTVAIAEQLVAWGKGMEQPASRADAPRLVSLHQPSGRPGDGL